MAYDVNRVMFVGRLGGDPRSFGEGESRTVLLNVAVGAGRDRTTWVQVKCFGKTADACEKYIGKGSKVAVDGRLSSYRRDLGDNRWRDELSIVAQQVQFLDPPSEESRSNEQAPPAAVAADDSLPF